MADFRAHGRFRSYWSCRPSGGVLCGVPETRFEFVGARALEGVPWVADIDADGALADVGAKSPA